jgi:hypothetical protein
LVGGLTVTGGESDCYCTRSEKGLGVLFRNELGLRERKKEKKKRGWWKYVDKKRKREQTKFPSLPL